MSYRIKEEEFQGLVRQHASEIKKNNNHQCLKKNIIKITVFGALAAVGIYICYCFYKGKSCIDTIYENKSAIISSAFASAITYSICKAKYSEENKIKDTAVSRAINQVNKNILEEDASKQIETTLGEIDSIVTKYEEEIDNLLNSQQKNKEILEDISKT